MHIISRKTLEEFAQRHRDSREPLDAWFKAAQRATWRNIMEVRRAFPHADAVVVSSEKIVTVFNIGGNKYRLVTAIHYNRGKVFLLKVMSHKEYDSNRWKESL